MAAEKALQESEARDFESGLRADQADLHNRYRDLRNQIRSIRLSLRHQLFRYIVVVPVRAVEKGGGD
jgi:hypothetical protein